MKRLLAALRSLRRPRAPLIPLSVRFGHFRAIGQANDAFLAALADLSERHRRGGTVAMSDVVAAYESLVASTGDMVSALNAMSGGAYQELARRHAAIERDIELDVLRDHPIEYGPLVVWPEDREASRPAVVGPKSARLVDIRNAGAQRVPPFFVVTVHGYRAFVEATGLHNLTQRVLGSSDLGDPRALRAACESIRAAVLAAAMPPGLVAAIWGAALKIRQHERADVTFAVRSSAVVEDTAVSFAGQFDSVLNVRDGQLLEAYKRVVASKYRPETVQYALASGFLDQDVEMPVLVMAMVDGRASGVASSRAPHDGEQALVTAVRGLAQAIVEGRVTPDRYLVPRNAGGPVTVLRGNPAAVTRCDPAGGVVEVPLDPRDREASALTEDEARAVTGAAASLEARFGAPQDVEWVIDRAGSLVVVQSRSTGAGADDGRRGPDRRSLHGYRILLRGALPAARGAASGRVYHRLDLSSEEPVPRDAVLVVPYAPPRLAGIVRRIAAIVSVSGSSTGHMATVAREAGIPCLVGAENAFASLAPGTLVTVDGWEGTVYEGEVKELLVDRAPRPAPAGAENPWEEMLKKLLAHVAPLTLTDPDSADFRPDRCQTLHDVARFVHQRAMAEMFDIDELSRHERGQAKMLAWQIPMPLLIVDLGGGLAGTASRVVQVDQILSVPLLALVEGMTDSRLRWAGPVGFDLRGFVSVVVRSTADDQRYGEASFAACARDFVHFSSRLAYHFATVEAICGESLNENYARFLFFGGAADAERREWRAHFLATVLRQNQFRVKLVGDRVEAVLAKHRMPVIEEALVMLGRLMVASRQLDMLMQSRAAADLFAASFLAGDYRFDHVRQGSRGATP